MTWLLPTALVLYAIGAFLQIAEAWRERGLTDTTYRSLAFLVAGPGLLAFWAAQTEHWVTVAATATPAILACWLIGWKLRDRLRSRGWL